MKRLLISILVGIQLCGSLPLYAADTGDITKMPTLSKKSTINLPELQKVVNSLWDDYASDVAKEYGVKLEGPHLDELFNKIMDVYSSKPLPEGYNSYSAFVMDSIRPTLESIKKKVFEKHQKEFSRVAVSSRKEDINHLQNLLSTLWVPIFLRSSPFFGGYLWCGCISVPDRLAYALNIVNDIREKFPNPKKEIIITGFATGGLFQEYMILKILEYFGYKNLVLNLIDLGYPDPVVRSRAKQLFVSEQPQEAKGLSPSEIMERYQQEFLEMHKSGEHLDFSQVDMLKELYPDYADIIDHGFIQQQGALESLKREFPHVRINVYRDMSEFLEKAKKYKGLQSDVIAIVDPDLDVFKVAPFPSLSNLLALNVDGVTQKYGPHVFIAIPKNAPIQVYVQSTAFKDAKVKVLLALIRNLAQKFKADKVYTPLFRDQLINLFARPSSSTKLTWYSDAHLAFKELVRDATKNDAIIYLYYTDEPILMKPPFKLERVNRSDYLKRDVFGPIIGNKLMKEGVAPFDEDEEFDEEAWFKQEAILPKQEEVYGRLNFNDGSVEILKVKKPQ